MKKLFYLFILFGNSAISQEVDLTPKPNQLFYLEIFAGASFCSITGFTFGAAANYQSNENIYTFRSVIVSEKKGSDFKKDISSTVAENYYKFRDILEFSLLYGKVYTFDHSSLSASLGISIYGFDEYLAQTGYGRIAAGSKVDINSKTEFGIPFEINFNFLSMKSISDHKGQKRNFFGEFGFKFYGNISKYNYMALGLTLGAGSYK